MPITAEQLDEFNTTVQSTLSPLLATIGVANPIAAAVIFATDMVFRFVKLGAQIRAEVEKARGVLDDAVRSEGIFRIPIDISLDEAAALSSFASGSFQAAFSKAYDQLKPEVEIVLVANHPMRPLAVKVLTRAFQLIPDVYGDCKIDSDPLLDDLFGKWLDLGNPRYGDLVREAVPFLDARELSIPHLQRLLPSYSLLKLELMGLKIETLTQSTLNTLNATIRDLVWKAVLGEKGAAKTVVAFAADRRIEQIDANITKLNADKKKIEDIPEADRKPVQKKQLQQITKRMAELEAQKKRIQEAKG